jgi:glutamine cyclotransferase
MRVLFLVLNGMSNYRMQSVANTKKQHRNVPDGIKWDKTRQKLLVTNELRSVIL